MLVCDCLHECVPACSACKKDSSKIDEKLRIVEVSEAS